MKKLLVIILIIAIPLIIAIQVPAFAAESFSTVEERMSGKEFMQTGLSKLTDDELFELNEWLRRHSVATLENASARPASTGAAYADSQSGDGADGRGFENTPKMDDNNKYDDTIHANIEGTFTGWRGKNHEFKLTNGMVWKSVEGGEFNIKATENPEVTIKKGFAGGWRLSMVGYNKKITVERIK